MSDYRKLTKDEIAALEARGCSAASWEGVSVRDPFRADAVHNVRFGGEVKLGSFEEPVAFTGGAAKPSGVYNSSVTNCIIGDNVLVANVANLANYDLADGVAVENVHTLAVEGESSFGNGVEVEALNEGGGREIRMYDRLSAQVAYLFAIHRHREDLQAKLSRFVDDYTASRRSSRGRVETGSRVMDCGRIVNVAIGPHAIIEGARSLTEGTIRGAAEDRVRVGQGVIAEDFIILSGSQVEGGAVLSRTFVGQGVRIGKQFSSENSVFFANCEGFHGEACSIFAGPYTVTHHKSTLLIAGLFSFYNAGSGTNQSNHMYKLGPVHQGALERGSKTASFSYLLWPCRVGPFSVVMDKHKANFDTSNLPFSYLTVEGDKSLITPAMNLFTVGTKRDSEKWPARDRRKDPDKLDLLQFALLSPYIMGRIVAGVAELRALQEKARKEQVNVPYKGAIIKRLMLSTACKYYELAIKIFLGEMLRDRVERASGEQELRLLADELAGLDAGAELEPWVDVSGMLAPARAVEELLDAVESGSVAGIDALNAKLKAIHQDYAKDEWSWFKALFGRRNPALPAAEVPEKLAEVFADWKGARVKLNNMILQDGTKEFDQSARLGFGLDGDTSVRDADFEAVRGTSEGNKFIKGLKAESEEIESAAAQLIESVRKLVPSR